MKKLIRSLPLIFVYLNATTQDFDDTTKVIQLKQVTVESSLFKNGIARMKDINDAVIVSGKKNEVIIMSDIEADLSTNNTRQIFAKVPGVSVWENDGSGIQVGIATRGLSPNRSWEFNVRQNGYDISSDVFGYPEAYFNPPMEALEKIEIIRGAASLAYGPQFGGVLNYKIKQANPNKALEIESRQTLGTYGLYNTFNALGGTCKKFSYYAYYHQRQAEGWRQNSQYKTHTAFINLSYHITSKIKMSAEYTHMNYLMQQAGGLTDSLFNINPKQSLRARNWFSTPWNLAALTVDYKISDKSYLTLKNFGMISQRNSVGYLKAININDTINGSIANYNNRQIDRDAYENFGSELRFVQNYSLLKQSSTLSIGIRYFKGNTHRRQIGTGSKGTDYDLTIDSYNNGYDFTRDLNFATGNFAVYVENMFKIIKDLSITPGIRYENISNTSHGRINTSGGNVSDKRNRSIYLLGLSAQYNTSSTTNVYANYSEAFRPVLYSELTPSGTTEIIDPNLKDVKGYNADMGWRGTLGNYLNFDVGVFYMFYDNRIGNINLNNAPFKTNIGASESKGIEAFSELDVLKIINKKSKQQFSVFASYAYVDARYVKWNNPAVANDAAKNPLGKRVENAPTHIARYGFTYHNKSFTFTYQLNNISDVYTDALNTEKPNAGATIGKIDGYMIMDLTFAYILNNNIHLRAGVNNLTNERYATRRAGGYPGPGLIPGNGRTLFVSIGLKL